MLYENNNTFHYIVNGFTLGTLLTISNDILTLKNQNSCAPQTYVASPA